jgi:hypothetical protein
MLAGTPQGLVEQEEEELQDVLFEQAAFLVGQLPQSFEEAHAARAATEVTRSRVFSVFMVLIWVVWFFLERVF